jgi:hypothetical protein
VNTNEYKIKGVFKVPSIKPTLTVRIKPEVRSRLELEADKHDRSISKMLDIILESYFDSIDNKVLTKEESELMDKLKNLPLTERQAIISNILTGKD